MAAEWASDRERISPKLSHCIELGLAMPYQDYLARSASAKAAARGSPKCSKASIFCWPPCVKGEAPARLESTGRPSFQAIWTTCTCDQ